VNRTSMLRAASRFRGNGTPRSDPKSHKGRLFRGEASIPRPDPGLSLDPPMKALNR
jgi:hypothetical protein